MNIKEFYVKYPSLETVDEDEDGEPIEEEREVLPDWYQGAGWYSESQNLIYEKGDEAFDDDGQTVAIREM